MKKRRKPYHITLDTSIIYRLRVWAALASQRQNEVIERALDWYLRGVNREMGNDPDPVLQKHLGDDFNIQVSE